MAGRIGGSAAEEGHGGASFIGNSYSYQSIDSQLARLVLAELMKRASGKFETGISGMSVCLQIGC